MIAHVEGLEEIVSSKIRRTDALYDVGFVWLLASGQIAAYPAAAHVGCNGTANGVCGFRWELGASIPRKNRGLGGTWCYPDALRIDFGVLRVLLTTDVLAQPWLRQHR